MPIILILAILLVTFIGYVIHKIRTRRMSRALGRDVTNNEALSLNTWMEVVEKEERQRKK